MQCHIKQNIVSWDFHKTQKQLNNVLYRHTHRYDKNRYVLKVKAKEDKPKSQYSDYLLGGVGQWMS